MTYDEATAGILLESALGVGSKPDLSPEQLNAALAASSVVIDGVVSYTSESLQIGAALGWRWKAGLIADKYELGAGSGKVLKQNQWFEQCSLMASRYGSGEWTVDGNGGIEGYGSDEDEPFFIVSPFLVGN